MFNNLSYEGVILYEDEHMRLIGELGDYALIHLEANPSFGKVTWEDRERILEIAFKKIRDRGYRKVFANILRTSFLAKEVRGVSRAEKMLNFKRLRKSKKILYLYRDI